MFFRRKQDDARRYTSPRPMWVRLLLMAVLIAICAIGFYFTNQITFDRVLNR